MDHVDEPHEVVPAAPIPAAPIVDFSRAGRRVKRSATILGGGALVGWLVAGLVTGSLTASGLATWVAVALAGMFVVEVVVVGGSAARGMLRAGDRGERLAGSDVGLLPPQVTQRLARRR